ncbi:hypothetical protein EZY14_010960 [Kordia sp. TARA_039_SRF]|nr:hypothetical protein EZY14_010960 [Kordia sp. TARA_039_SRF]
MNLTEAHIEFISNSLEFHGLQSESIKDDIIDHICTTIENSEHHDFRVAYEEAIQQLGGYYNIKLLQKESKQLVHEKMYVRMKQIQFIVGILLIITFSLGFILKMFQWPYANFALLSGLSILLLGYTPIYLYIKYKQSLFNYQS